MNYKIAEPIIPYNENDNIIDKILKIRGIQNREDFLFPKESYTYSYWDLSNMDTVANMIAYSIQNKLNVGIYGDIDNDGVNSLAVIYHYYKYHGIETQLLYHQRNQGHGVIVDNVPKDLDLLIIVDSSTNSVEECKQLSEFTNICILDHHKISEENPYAYICNPQMNDYPNKELSGGGVCYKVCQAVDELLQTNFANELIDFVAVAMLGDMMNMTSMETRHLVNKGIFKLQKKPSLQYSILLKQLKKQYMPTSQDINFYVVPFINSIIRLGQIEKAITILTSNDEKTIKDTIKECVKLNDSRKVIQAKMVKEIDPNIDHSHKTIFYVTNSKTSERTLNGLVANNIMNKYKKPTFILSKHNERNTYVGSGRSLGSVDLQKLISNSGLVVEAEGHEGAFGIEVECDKLDVLINYLDEELKDVTYDATTIVDLEINQNDISWEILQDLKKLSFCVGEGFKEPLFLVKYMFKTNETKVMKEIHVKLVSGEFECVKFNLSEDEVEKLKNAFCFDIIGSLGINSFYNFKTKTTNKTKQILIKDINVY